MRAEIEAVHGARDVQVAVGVEGADEALCQSLQVALNRELGSERIAALHVVANRRASEAQLPFRSRSVGHRAELARQALARDRRAFGAVVAAPPVRIMGDRFALDRAQRDSEGRRGGGPRDTHQPPRGAGKLRGVREHHHAPERGAHDGVEALDAERAHGLEPRTRDVLDREIGKRQPIRLAGCRIDRSRPGRSEAAAERVDADDEEALGVDGQSRPHHPLPPPIARIGGGGGGVSRRREAGEQQQRIVARRILPPPGLIGDARAVQHPAAPHGKRVGQRCVLARIHGIGTSADLDGRPED